MPKVTERDREHMRKLGRWKHESHAEALREHLALSGTERLAAAVQLMVHGPHFTPVQPKKQIENPSALHDCARRLGLYRA
jgi:hypothetical protein